MLFMIRISLCLKVAIKHSWNTIRGGGKEPTCIYAQGKHNIEIDGDPVICWPKTWPIDQNIFIIVVVVCWGGQRCKEVCKGVVTPSWLVKSVPGINQF